MNLLKNSLFILWCAVICGCQPQKKESSNYADSLPESVELNSAALQEHETAYFASGCFWCVEAIFEHVKGVKEVVSGYAGGKEENPTYEQVAYGRTSHAEAVAIYYNPEEISFDELVKIFFGTHDPTTLNRQGPDRGAQYRSIAFYTSEEEKQAIEYHIQELVRAGTYTKPIVTEVVPFTKFYEAEAYHQDFEKNNPGNSYIQNVSIPRFNRFKAKYPEYVSENH